MKLRIIQVDAFADKPFTGNPAAVALIDGTEDDSLLQAIALEMNLSETAFPCRRSDGDWDLRWFTPAAEVDLCGHATLATAHVLFNLELVAGGRITFHTRSGPLICEQAEAGIVMDFPAAPAQECPPVDGLSEALGVEVLDCGRAFDLLAQVASPEVVAGTAPDLQAVAEIDTRAVIVTAAGDIDGGPADFVSRVFGPRVGVPEDPVTGSAHCILGPWWGERLGRSEMQAHQISARGGRLNVQLNDDRVSLTGQAITVLDGHLTTL